MHVRSNPADSSTRGRYPRANSRREPQLEALESRWLLSIVRPDHVVVVIEEDRAANAIGDVANMPYFNQLAATGLVYNNSHSIGRPSRLDYLALFSGSTQGVTDNFAQYPLFTTPN